LPLTTLGQETRWAYSTPLPSPHGPRGGEGKVGNREGVEETERMWRGREGWEIRRKGAEGARG